MSRKKKSPAPAAPKTPTADNPEGILPDEIARTTARERQREREEVEIFSAFRRVLGGGGMVSLRRSHPRKGQFKPAYIATIPLDQFSLENVKQIYGGGDFEATGKNAMGQNVTEASGKFSIDHSIDPKNPDETKEKPAPAAPPLDLAAIIRETRESASKETSGMMELAKVILTRPAQAPDNTILLQVIQMQKESEARLLQVMQESEKRTQSILKEIAASRTDAEPPKSLREQLEDAKELMELIGGDRREKEESTFEKLLRGLAPLGERIAAHYLAGGAPTPPIVPVLPAPNGVVTAPPASGFAPNPAQAATAAEAPAAEGGAGNISPEQMSMLLNLIRSAALEAASKRQDAFEFVASQMPIVEKFGYHGALYELLRGEDWFARVFAADAKAAQFVGYLGEIREAILTRAFVTHGANQAAKQTPAAQAAKDFLGWLTSFDDGLLSLADDDDAWRKIFEGYAIAPEWLALYRATVIHELAADDEAAPGAKVSPFPSAAPIAPKVADDRSPAEREKNRAALPGSMVKTRATKPGGKSRAQS